MMSNNFVFKYFKMSDLKVTLITGNRLYHLKCKVFFKLLTLF